MSRSSPPPRARCLWTRVAQVIPTLSLRGAKLTIPDLFFRRLPVIDSIKTAAKSLAKGLIGQYNGTKPGETIGVFGLPYYWWSSGAIWDAMVDYYSLTGDDTYNTVVQQALVAQLGPGNNFMDPNWTATLGNDDQSTWGMAALTAAERGFAAPGSSLSWVGVASNVFDSQAARWEESQCDGGLRWQIPPTNAGYNYKNSASAANFLQMAARLAQLTGNQTYADWAGKAYNWLTAVGYLTPEGWVYDGAHIENNWYVFVNSPVTKYLLRYPRFPSWRIDRVFHMDSLEIPTSARSASWANFALVKAPTSTRFSFLTTPVSCSTERPSCTT